VATRYDSGSWEIMSTENEVVGSGDMPNDFAYKAHLISCDDPGSKAPPVKYWETSNLDDLSNAECFAI
jgi:hypothetical protein